MKFIKNISDEFIKGSLILFILINLFNFLNYIFHFSMARLLGPSNYGVFAVLMSIIYIFLIPMEAIQTVITKYTTKFNIKKEYGKIKTLLLKSIKKGFLFAFVLFLIFLPIAFFLSDFLKIKFTLLVLTGLLIFYAFIIPIVRGILQGRKKFTELGLNMVLEASFKIVLGVALIFAGWKVYGAITGMIIAGAIAFIFVFFSIKQILASKKQKADFKEIYHHGMSVTVAMISVVLMYSLDIILAKRFFALEIAGKYAVISMLGKMIFFGTYSIGKTMFPLTSEGHEKGKPTQGILWKSLKIVSGLCLIALLIYLFFPKLIIRILFGAAYIDVSGILFIVGLAFAFLSIANIIILYNLSVNKMKKSSFILLAFVILEIVLLSFFHSTLFEFSIALLVVNFLIFLYALFRYLNN